jgi:hypothetical protein
MLGTRHCSQPSNPTSPLIACSFSSAFSSASSNIIIDDRGGLPSVNISMQKRIGVNTSSSSAG